MFCVISHTAKVLWLWRLQHGQGQNEEQAASCGRAWQEPGDWWPHSHAAGSAPEKVLFGDQQASRLAFVIAEAPPPLHGSQQTTLLLLTCVPNMSTPSPLLSSLFHLQAPLALTYRAELYKLKFHLLVCGRGRVGGTEVLAALKVAACTVFPPCTALLCCLPYVLVFRCSKMH